MLSYLCGVFFGTPYVLLIRKVGPLNFWAFATPILWFGLVFLVLLSAISGTAMPFIEGILVFLPAVFLSVSCFYFIGVWRSP
jgi:hypothetical protein